MSYQYLGQNSSGKFNYKITIDMYRDCSGGIESTVQFDPEIEIGIYHSNATRSKYRTEKIRIVTKRIVPAPGKANCPFDKNFCIEEGFYEKVIELDASTLGYELTYEVCCRNEQQNISKEGQSTPTQGQTYYCKIPRTVVKNSSPVFIGNPSSVPSPYMCANDTTSFLNSAVDLDGDSLVYYFVKPFGGSSQTGGSWVPPPNLSLKTIKYNSGFSEDFPFGASGYCKIDRFNGLTSYFTTTTGNYVVAVEVAEYRNGELLSTVRLDLQIIFINCPPNRKPTITGDKGKDFEIEAGSKLCFNVIANDADNDNLKLTPSGNIFTGLNGWKGPKATLSAKTGKGTIVSEFCWQTSCDQASSKPYQFAVTVFDDGCPGKFNAANFTIKVNPFISNAFITGSNSLCQNAIENYTANNLALKTSIEWEVTNGIILSGQGTKTLTVKWTGSSPGKVRLRETSQYGCKGDWKELMVTIISSPSLPLITGPDTVCLGANGEYFEISNFAAGLTAKWFAHYGNIVVNNNGKSVGVEMIYKGNQLIKVFTTNSSGCKSDTAYKKVNVRKPQPLILGPSSVCPNAQKIEYIASGFPKSTYQWSVNGGTISSGTNNQKVFINWGDEGMGNLTVTETDRFGCVSIPINYSVNKSYTLDSETPKGKTSVCEFEKGVSYYLYPANGTSFTWNITGGSLLPPVNSNLIKVDWGKAGLGSVESTRNAYDSVNKRACISLPVKINVIINPTPNADLINGDFDVCQLPDSLSYTLNGFAGSSYLWRINNSSSNISGQGTKTIKMAWNKPGTFTIDVIELSKDSCLGVLIDTFIIVHPKPTADSILGPATVCDPDYANRLYYINGLNKSVYTWSINNGTILSGNGTDSIRVNWTENEPAWLTVRETSEFGCVGDSIFKEVILDKLNIEMLVVSVGTPDDRMEINWKNPNSKALPRVYEIQKKKTSDLVWKDLVSVNNFSNYIEQPLNTDANPFDYRINVKDLCGVEKTTDIHTNVWLWGSKTEDPYAVKMQFTPYSGFKGGVTKYIVYRKVSDVGGGFQPYDSFSQPENLFYKNGLEGYLQCYRVLSYENGGNTQKSWSNEICFNFAPTIYIPNAFTPDGDGINDRFTISAGAIKTFNMKIFDRWGEKLWETKDFKESGWDGTYKDKPVQLDVYMYTITLTDFRDKVYNMNGTVHVIR